MDLRGELDSAVGEAAARVVREATIVQSSGKGALSGIRGKTSSSLGDSASLDRDGERPSGAFRASASTEGANSPSTQSSRTLKLNAESVHRIGWISKRGDAVFSSYHKRYFVMYGNKCFVYFDNLAEADAFIHSVRENNGLLPLSQKVRSRTVDLASIISAQDKHDNNGGSASKTLVVSSLNKCFTLAAM